MESVHNLLADEYVKACCTNSDEPIRQRLRQFILLSNHYDQKALLNLFNSAEAPVNFNVEKAYLMGKVTERMESFRSGEQLMR